MLRVQCVSGFMYKKMTKSYANNNNNIVITLFIVILLKVIVILIFDLPTRQLVVTGDEMSFVQQVVMSLH